MIFMVPVEMVMDDDGDVDDDGDGDGDCVGGVGVPILVPIS